MTMHVKSGGTWREVDPPSVKVSGTWQTVTEGYVKVAGVWEQFYASSAVTLTAFAGMNAIDVSAGPWTSRAGVQVNSDGTIDLYSGIGGGPYTLTQQNASTDWVIPNGAAPDDYEVRLTNNSLSTAPSSGPSLGTWHPLTVSRRWYYEKTNSGTTSLDWKIEIRKGTGAVLDSADWSGNVENG